jgi:hypothetical protein
VAARKVSYPSSRFGVCSRRRGLLHRVSARPRFCTAAQPGDGGAETAEVGGEPITAAHLRELLAQLDAVCPGGLRVPAGGSLNVALVDPGTGALRATVSRAVLERLARRGCLRHPTGRGVDMSTGRSGDMSTGGLSGGSSGCSCPVLDRPRRSAATPRPGATPVRHRPGPHLPPSRLHPPPMAPTPTTSPPGPTAGRRPARTCAACRRHHRLKSHAPGWRFTMTPDGELTVTTPSGVTRTTRPSGMQHLAPPATAPPATAPPPAAVPEPEDPPPD